MRCLGMVGHTGGMLSWRALLSVCRVRGGEQLQLGILRRR
jgi:hypothetical protein